MPKTNFYILVEATRVSTGKKCTKAYENFEELKEEAIKILDGCGWDNKQLVDLRSVDSCLKYVLSGNYCHIQYRLSTSYSKFMEYRYGRRALV